MGTCQKTDTPPYVDGTQATTAAINAVYADCSGGMCDLYLHKSDLEQYRALTIQIKELEVLKNEIANRVKAFMGESDRGECGKYRVSWKSSTRKTFDNKRFAEENPELDLSGFFN